MVGKTRFGKSSWIRQPTVCGSLERAIVLDTKFEQPWLEFARRFDYVVCDGEASAIAALRAPAPPPRILARCWDPLGRPGADLTQAIFDRRFGTTVVDELAHWCRGHETTRGLRLIWTTGGGLGIGGYGCAQRPVDLWNGFISETDRRVIFRLELRDDEETLEAKGVPGVVGRASALDRFWWLYHSADDAGPAVLMAPVPIG